MSHPEVPESRLTHLSIGGEDVTEHVESVEIHAPIDGLEGASVVVERAVPGFWWGWEQPEGHPMSAELGDALDALDLCRQLHKGQERFDGEPYAKHPERVAAIVARSDEYRSADDATKRHLIVTSLLHDAVEDTGYTVDQARAQFGDTVATALAALTHREGETYYAYMRIVRNNRIAKVVKRADLSDNIATLPFNRSRLWAKYADAIAQLAAPREPV